METTVERVRNVTGLNSTDMSDEEVRQAILIAQDFVDAKINTSFETGQKSMAVLYCAAATVLERKVAETGTNPPEYDIGPISVDMSDVDTLLNGMAKKFRWMFREITSEAISPKVIRRFDDRN